MNTELKALINTIFDGEKFVMDTVNKNYMSLIMDGMALLGDAPGDIAGFAGLQQELSDLQKPANQADLITYIQSKVAGQLSGAKALAILNALVMLLKSGIAFEQAIVS